MAVARTEHGSPVEQRLCFDLPPVPQQIEPLGKISLRKAWIEFNRYIDGRQRLVILTAQAQRAPEGAVTKTIEVVERHGGTCLPQCRFKPRRANLGIVIQRALDVDVGECAMAAGEIRICFDRALKIALGLIEPR